MKKYLKKDRMLQNNGNRYEMRQNIDQADIKAGSSDAKTDTKTDAETDAEMRIRLIETLHPQNGRQTTRSTMLRLPGQDDPDFWNEALPGEEKLLSSSIRIDFSSSCDVTVLYEPLNQETEGSLEQVPA